MLLEEYRESLARIKVLSHAETLEHYRRMQNGDQESRNALICSVLRLAFKMVAKKKPKDAEKAISDANLAAIRAVDDWRPEKGRLSTLAGRYVKNILLRPNDYANAAGIRLPISTVRLARRLQHESLDSIVPSPKGRDRQKRRGEVMLAAAALQGFSIDVVNREGKRLFDIPEPKPESTRPCLADVGGLLRNIPEKPRKAVCLMYGLRRYPQTSLAITARILQLTESETRALVKKTLKRIQLKPCKRCGTHFRVCATNRNYCSERCRKAETKRSRAKPRPKKECAHCGETFSCKRASGYNKQRYCSRKCKDSVKRVRS